MNDGDGVGGTKFDGATAKVSVDGVAAAAKSSKAGSITTLTVDISPFFASGSSHTAKLESSAVTVEKSFNINSYVLLTKGLKVTADTSKAGFRMRVFQNEARTENSAARAEAALAGLLKDSAGEPLPDLTDLALAGTDGFFTIDTVINFDQGPAAQGNFNEANGNADEGIPGIPGTGGSTDGIAAEILTFLDLPKGVITMGFNSDDGFRTYAGNVKDALNGGLDFSMANGLGEFHLVSPRFCRILCEICVWFAGTFILLRKIGCPTWIRTMTNASKGHCATITPSDTPDRNLTKDRGRAKRNLVALSPARLGSGTRPYKGCDPIC